MYPNRLRGHQLSVRKSRRFCGEVLVFPSNFVPGVGLIREDFILVMITLLLSLISSPDRCRVFSKGVNAAF